MSDHRFEPGAQSQLHGWSASGERQTSAASLTNTVARPPRSRGKRVDQHADEPLWRDETSIGPWRRKLEADGDSRASGRRARGVHEWAAGNPPRLEDAVSPCQRRSVRGAGDWRQYVHARSQRTDRQTQHSTKTPPWPRFECAPGTRRYHGEVGETRTRASRRGAYRSTDRCHSPPGWD